MTDPVKRTARGWRKGESHPNADLTDREIELMRRLHEQDKMTVTELAEKFEKSKGYVSMVLRYLLRV